jgi:hypothetical protein
VIVLAAAVAAGLSLLVAWRAPAARSSDLTKAMAFMKKQCPGGQRDISARMWAAGWRFNALYGNCLAEDGTDGHIWFFDHGRFIGRDAPTPSHEIIGLWRNDRTIAFMYVLYRQSDANCCATGGGAIVRFRWNGKRVRPLDPLPPRAHTKGVRVGR